MSQIASVVVLAAGQGKRMKSTLPKVLHPGLRTAHDRFTCWRPRAPWTRSA